MQKYRNRETNSGTPGVQIIKLFIVGFSTATTEDVWLTYRVISGTGGLGADASKFPYRRAKNCLGEDGLVMLVADEAFFNIILLFLLFEPSSVSAAVDVDIIDDALSTVDSNISPQVYRTDVLPV